LFEIERAAVAGRLLRMTNLGGENNHQKCETTNHSRFQFVHHFIRDCRFRQTDPSFAKGPVVFRQKPATLPPLLDCSVLFVAW
jgi:hypothetical protein